MDRLASSDVCIFPADLFLHRDKWFARSCLNLVLPALGYALVINKRGQSTIFSNIRYIFSSLNHHINNMGQAHLYSHLNLKINTLCLNKVLCPQILQSR